MDCSPLAERLGQPARRLTLDDLPSVWFHSTILICCRGAASLAGEEGVPGKIRGAWGESLKATASPEAIDGEPCPWSPPCALDVFMHSQGHVTKATEIPKPFVFALLANGDDLFVRLTLMGFATDWTEMAAEALVRALRGPLSIGRSLEVIDRRYWSEEQLSCPAGGTKAAVLFETPLQIRQKGQTLEPDLPTVVATLGNRISGMARWQDIAIEDTDWQALKAHAAGIMVTPLATGEAAWKRFSRRQNQSIPMTGRRPSWLLHGDLAPLMPLLTIGANIHAGGRAALGLGRFRLEVMD